MGEQQANIARAEGVRQANVLQAQGEAQAITTIDEQLRQSPQLFRMAQIPEMGWPVASGRWWWIRSKRSISDSIHRDSNK